MKKTSEIKTYLSVFFVVCMVVSNIITAKQVQLPLGIVMTGGILIFPFTYILSDVFSECYGYRWSRITCYMAFLANLFAVVLFQIVINTPAPSFWDGQEAFVATLGSTPRILVASLAAYVMGDLMNDKVFRVMKRKHENEIDGFGYRAIASSVIGELFDSLVFFPIAFAGQMPAESLVQMAALEIAIKVGYEIVILPFTTMVVKYVNTHEQAMEQQWLTSKTS